MYIYFFVLKANIEEEFEMDLNFARLETKTLAVETGASPSGRDVVSFAAFFRDILKNGCERDWTGQGHMAKSRLARNAFARPDVANDFSFHLDQLPLALRGWIMA